MEAGFLPLRRPDAMLLLARLLYVRHERDAGTMAAISLYKDAALFLHALFGKHARKSKVLR